MPGISTHVHFAHLLLPKLETPYDPFYFVLGSVATDCFEQGNDESFRLYHFIGQAREIDLERFLDVTRITRQSGNPGSGLSSMAITLICGLIVMSVFTVMRCRWSTLVI